MNVRTFAKYWRTILIVAEMNIRQQLMDGFILFTVLFQPIIIALLGLWMLKDKGPDAAMFVVVGALPMPMVMIIVLMSVAGILQGVLRPARDMLMRAVIPRESFGKAIGMVATGAAIGGARSNIAIDLSDRKLAAARALGASPTINPGQGDVRHTGQSLTGGRAAGRGPGCPCGSS